MHAGYLKTKCGTCHSQEPDVRDALGCNPLVTANAPAWQIQEEDRVVNFYNCPVMFIPETVWNFWKTYKAYTRTRVRLPDVQPAKYLQACDIYEGWKPHFEMLKMQDDHRQSQINKIAGMRL